MTTQVHNSGSNSRLVTGNNNVGDTTNTSNSNNTNSQNVTHSHKNEGGLKKDTSVPVQYTGKVEVMFSTAGFGTCNIDQIPTWYGYFQNKDVNSALLPRIKRGSHLQFELLEKWEDEQNTYKIKVISLIEQKETKLTELPDDKKVDRKVDKKVDKKVEQNNQNFQPCVSSIKSIELADDDKYNNDLNTSFESNASSTHSFYNTGLYTPSTKPKIQTPPVRRKKDKTRYLSDNIYRMQVELQQQQLRTQVAHTAVIRNPPPFAKCRYRGCSMHFLTSKKRQEHEKIHEQERPYDCMFCGKRFHAYTNLKHHVTRRHIQ